MGPRQVSCTGAHIVSPWGLTAEITEDFERFEGLFHCTGD